MKAMTHVHRESKRWFNLEHCETCNGEIEACNGVSIHPGDIDKVIENLGVIEVPNRLPEGWYDEETEMEVCEACS